MSNKNLVWLFFGIGIGVLIHMWWTRQQRIIWALADHDNRLMALEHQSRQCVIADWSPKDSVKWYATILAAAALKLIDTLVQFCDTTSNVDASFIRLNQSIINL